MEWVEELKGKTVSIDTSPLNFFIEEHAIYGPIVDPFFEAASKGEIDVVTSTVVLLEVLVHPIRQKNAELAQRYNDILLSSPHIAMTSVTPKTAQVAAELRASSNLRTPDAIHLATAITHDADALLTNDRDFGQHLLSVPVLRVRNLAKTMESHV